MGEKLRVPKFETEEEEAAWWPQQEDAIADAFEAALLDGTLMRGDKPITVLSLDLEDAQAAREQAELRGVDFVSYLESLVHEAVQQEQRRAS